MPSCARRAHPDARTALFTTCARGSGRAYRHTRVLSAPRSCGTARTGSAAEPLVDTRLAVTFGQLKDQIGLPLALILKFEKR